MSSGSRKGNVVFANRSSSRDSGNDSRYDSRYPESPRESTQAQRSPGSPSRSTNQYSRGNDIPPLTGDFRSMPGNQSPRTQQQGPLVFSAPSPYSQAQPSNTQDRTASGRTYDRAGDLQADLVSVGYPSRNEYKPRSGRSIGFTYAGRWPLRIEYRILLTIGSFITAIVDPIFYQVEAAAGAAVALLLNKYSGYLAAVCFVPALVVIVPVGLFCVTLGLPLFIPFVFFASFLAFINGALLAALLAASPPVRRRIYARLRPHLDALTASEIGRRLLYEGAPRPSLLELAAAAVPRTPVGQLAACLALDAVGSMSYLLPFLGEGADLAWAPLQAAAMGAMFDGVNPAAKWVGLAEELLPMTDIIPSATITWFSCNSDALKGLHLLQPPTASSPAR